MACGPIDVLAVMFLHLPRRGLLRGYVWVGMLLVLSGYLITAIIHRESQAQDFSLRRFYERQSQPAPRVCR